MTIQIVRNENNEITTGNLCVFNGKTKRKIYCVTYSWRWLNLMPSEGVDIRDFVDSLRLTIDGVDKTINVYDEERGWEVWIEGGNNVEFTEEKAMLHVEDSTLFTICSTYDFTHSEMPM